MPCLSGVEPLELLLEIGLQKARTDYEYIFTASQLCTCKELAAAVAKSVTSNVAATTSDASSVSTNNRQTMMLRNGGNVAGGNGNGDDDMDGDNDDDDASGIRKGLRNSTFNRTGCEHQLSRLAHLHLLMEHLMRLQIHLNWNDGK